jgi:hypothetical protein
VYVWASSLVFPGFSCKKPLPTSCFIAAATPVSDALVIEARPIEPCHMHGERKRWFITVQQYKELPAQIPN